MNVPAFASRKGGSGKSSLAATSPLTGQISDIAEQAADRNSKGHEVQDAHQTWGPRSLVRRSIPVLLLVSAGANTINGDVPGLDFLNQPCQYPSYRTGDIPMPSIEAQIADIASRLAAHQQHHASGLQNEINEIEARKVKLLAERDLARSARERLTNFQVKIGADYQCPDCWISRNVRSALYPIGDGERHLDRFRCRSCDQVWEFSF